MSVSCVECRVKGSKHSSHCSRGNLEELRYLGIVTNMVEQGNWGRNHRFHSISGPHPLTPILCLHTLQGLQPASTASSPLSILWSFLRDKQCIICKRSHLSNCTILGNHSISSSKTSTTRIECNHDLLSVAAKNQTIDSQSANERCIWHPRDPRRVSQPVVCQTSSWIYR